MNPQPYAYNKGPAIIVEDFFENNPGRKRALTDYAELHKNYLDIVIRP